LAEVWVKRREEELDGAVGDDVQGADEFVEEKNESAQLRLFA